MTLKQAIANKAAELVALLEHCDDGDFIDKVLYAVQDGDSLMLWNMEEAEDEGI